MAHSVKSKGGGDGPAIKAGGGYLEAFEEAKEIQEIIGNLINIYEDQIAVERATERFLYVVDKYQEQPHLLDPHLESLLGQLLDIVKDKSTPTEVMHLAFKLLYLITKTRGFKVIVRLMPHEVADLEPVLAMLAEQDPADTRYWEARYMLLLWLSIVCMIPFDMVRLDSNIRQQSGEVKTPVMQRIIDTGKKYLDVVDKSRDAAAYMLSKFMTRPDVTAQKLPEFLDWSLVTLKKLNSGTATMSQMQAQAGVLSTIALLFKVGKRADLVDYAPTVLRELGELNLKESQNTILRKLTMKLTQRLGLTFLKAKQAAWRYQRGSRSLADNLKDDASSVPGQSKQLKLAAEEEDEEYDIPDEIEEVLELLLIGLRDKDTIVRWSAAKGVGRVTGRLPKELADDVVGSIMELFTIAETDGAWHGGCLALAELGRRGLLLPQRLPDVVPVIIKALAYDEKRGNFSVGAHVRDAACYVCWAFARAYDPREIQPHVHQISNALVIVTVFDKEGNVRRAAAAAFQENVGRQGQFPHGIDILTHCDYFTVGSRTHCYQELSVYVGQFREYTQALIDHLVTVKTSHWDSTMRELTSQALYNLTPIAPEYMAHPVLPQLIPLCTSMDLSQRHGAILAAARITHALADIAVQHDKTLTDLIGWESSEGLKNITAKLQAGQQFRGLGGELMRSAVCVLIEKLSLAKMPYHTDSIIGVWQDLIDDCLEHVEPDIQACAIQAIPAFVSEYYILPNGEAKPDKQELLLDKYLHQLKATLQTTRCGYSLALGGLPKFFLSGKLEPVLQGLITAITISGKGDNKWTDARRDAVKALTSVCESVGVEKTGYPGQVLCEANIDRVFDALFAAMKDYTLDSRGDVGALVREAAMTGLYKLTCLTVSTEPSLLSQHRCESLFCSLVQQASEKIDRTRAHAGDIFGQLLYHSPEIPYIPHKEELQRIFTKEEVVVLNWAVPSATFPKFTQLLSLPTYTYPVLLGLTVSVGGLTESLVKSSASSLLSYLRDISSNKTASHTFTETLLQMFRDNQKVDRVSLPLFKMLDQLLANGCFDDYIHDVSTFPLTLFTLSKQEITRCGEVQKLLASIEVFIGLLQFPGDVRQKTLFQLAVFLCHKYPIVRKTTANRLYEALVTYDDIMEAEHLDDVMTLLSDTQWDEPVNDVRPIRNELCDLMKINKPVAKAKVQEQKQEQQQQKPKEEDVSEAVPQEL